ncbi:Gag-Pol polyprotein [Frankliniella fusca]|uniref:Gag-Pol polyprotein n=1 Tax=Frankliniella fusca TaxID=407009 RepID=A0AAE1HEP3_9NEOP|nr:Gag-Pol polyprotein [Frankliniella fusca]
MKTQLCSTASIQSSPHSELYFYSRKSVVVASKKSSSRIVRVLGHVLVKNILVCGRINLTEYDHNKTWSHKWDSVNFTAATMSDRRYRHDRGVHHRGSPDGNRDILARWAEANIALQAHNTDLLQQLSAMQRRAARYVEVPKFDGSRAWCVFEAQFQSVAVENGWSVEEQGRHLLGALEGPAADVVQTLPPNEYLSYARLSDCLRRHFDWARGTAAAALQFEQRIQQPGESLRDFASALLCLARAAYPSWPDHSIQTVCMRSFLSGIGDADVRRTLYLQQPKDLDDAVAAAAAVHVEMVNNLYPVRGAQLAPAEPAAVQSWDCRDVAARCVAAADGASEQLRGELRSRLAPLPAHARTPSTSSGNTSRRRAPTSCSVRSRARSRTPRRDRCEAARRGACFFCGETGHARRSCPHEDRRAAPACPSACLTAGRRPLGAGGDRAELAAVHPEFDLGRLRPADNTQMTAFMAERDGPVRVSCMCRVPLPDSAPPGHELPPARQRRTPTSCACAITPAGGAQRSCTCP